jgi:hypothetical protein
VFTAGRDPVYAGKRQSAWIGSLDGEYQRIDKDNFARELGTNIVPVLLKAIGRRDTGVARWYRGLWPELPTLIKARLPVPVNNVTIRTNAAILLSVVGDAPTLERLITNHPDALVRASAAAGLAFNASDGATSALAAAAVRDTSVEVRRGSVAALQLYGRNQKVVAGAATRCLADADNIVRLGGIRVLADKPEGWDEALPLIGKALKDRNPAVSNIAAGIVENLTPEARAEAGLEKR